jgi:transposase InsO family protein
MSLRKEFITLATAGSSSMQLVCDRFGISRKTGYKWLHRFQRGGWEALADQSRQPHSCPWKTSPAVEEAILKLRQAHPAWGARKLRLRLQATGWKALPSASTITAILRRHGCIDQQEAIKHHPWQRFEAQEPNALWQMDFKGHFPVLGGRCHPLTVLDDHSRYNIGLVACLNETEQTVQNHLTALFRRFGLPQWILVDNGSPWGTRGNDSYSSLAVWLMHIGIGLSHARILHPQTLGKDERFHRTLKAEVLLYCINKPITECQQRFDHWRILYNTQRPHEALKMDVPSQHYHLSDRPFPERLPPIDYSPVDQVRKVQGKGELSFRGRTFIIGKAFHHYPVALRPTQTDGVFDVYFSTFKITQINLHDSIDS